MRHIAEINLQGYLYGNITSAITLYVFNIMITSIHIQHRLHHALIVVSETKCVEVKVDFRLYIVRRN